MKGQLGKRKGRMTSVEEDGMPHTIRDRLEVDNLHQFLRDTQTYQAPVMTSPNISNVLFEGRGVSSSSERSPVCNLGVFEVTETAHKAVWLALGTVWEEFPELEVEDTEWSWPCLFGLLTDFSDWDCPDKLHQFL